MKLITFLVMVLLGFMPLVMAHFTEFVDDFAPGDVVSVNRPGVPDEREGLVTDTFVDAYGRQVVQVQFDRGEIYRTWVPYVKKVEKVIRKTYYTVPQEPRNYRLVEKIYTY